MTYEVETSAEPERVRQAITRLPPTGASAGQARDAVSTALRSWAVPENLVFDVVLAASELVTNAIEHGRGEVTVAVELLGREVVLRVRDDTPDAPTAVPQSPLSPRSRGLAIVQALSGAWGYQPVRGGKWVWARFPVPASKESVTSGDSRLARDGALPPRA